MLFRDGNKFVKSVDITMHTQRMMEKVLKLKVKGASVRLPTGILGYNIELNETQSRWISGLIIDGRKITFSVSPKEKFEIYGGESVVYSSGAAYYFYDAFKDYCDIIPQKSY